MKDFYLPSPSLQPRLFVTPSGFWLIYIEDIFFLHRRRNFENYGALCLGVFGPAAAETVIEEIRPTVHLSHLTVRYTVCPRSSGPFYKVTYYINWATTSWTYSMVYGEITLHQQFFCLNSLHPLGYQVKDRDLWIRGEIAWIRILTTT